MTERSVGSPQGRNITRETRAELGPNCANVARALERGRAGGREWVMARGGQVLT